MKKGRYCHSIFYFSILVLSLFSISASFAQDNTQIGLPEGAIARLGKGGINVMRFSPDGTRLAVGTDVGVWLYNVLDGKEITLPTGDVRYFISLAFSTDGKTLASCGSLNTSIHLWDTETGSKRLSIKLSDRFSRVSALVFTRENKTLTGLGANRYITEWDVETGEKLEQKSSSLPRRVLAFSQDGKTFVTGHEENGNVRLGYTVSGYEGEVFKEKKHPVIVNPIPELLDNDPDEEEVSKGIQAIAYSPDSKTIASAHDDNTVRLWDTTTKTERVILKGHTEKIDALAFSHDSTMLASGSFDNTIQLWNVQNEKWRGMLTRHKNSIKALAFSPTEKGLLASGSSDGTVRFWDTITGQERSIFATEHIESVKALAFTANNTMLASAASNGTVQIWNLKIGKVLAAPPVAFYDSTVGSVFSSDATLFASHGVDTIVESKGSNVPTTLIPHNKTQLWNLPAGDELLTLIGKVNAFAFSPDKKIFATSDANETLLWDVNTGAKLFRLEARQFIGDVVVGFSPDGTILATGGKPGETHLWVVNTGEKLATLKDPIVGNAELFAFSLDNTLLAVKYSARIRLWDLKTKQAYNTTLADQILIIDVLTFSPDGKILLATNWHHDTGSQIQLWDVASERKLLTLAGHSERIETLVFSHNGKVLASGSQDGTVLLWDWDKIIAKIGVENIGKADRKKLEPDEPVKFASKAKEAEAVLNWLEKHNYQVKKLGEKVSITQGKSRTLILGSGGTMRTSDLNFTLSRTSILQIGVKNVGTAVFTFDEKGDLKYENSKAENQPSQEKD